MNQLTLKNYLSRSDLEKTLTRVSQNINRTQIKQIFE